MKRQFRDYQEKLLEDLQDGDEAIAYLQEASMDEDPRIFLLALKNVITAQKGNISELAKEINLNRENLYRMLSTQGNPRYTNLVTLLHSVGLRLSVEPLSINLKK
jgi:probable addiction module antidote protein